MPKGRERRTAPLSPQLRLSFEKDEGLAEPSVRVRCSGCAKVQLRPQWYQKEGMRLHFCGPSCRSAWLASHESPLASDLPPPPRPTGHGGSWDVQASRARERDGYRCCSCRIPEEELEHRLDVHHKVPARLFASSAEANRLSNLISLCRTCHRRLETEGEMDLPLFAGQGQRG